MGTLEDAHTSDFYKPFRRLLDPSDQEGGAPADFTDVIDELWASLHEWVTDVEEGARGASSFETHPHFIHIGFALKQAAVRGSDRPLLRRLFESMALDEQREPDLDHIREHLKIWAQRQGSRGKRLAELAADERPIRKRLCLAIIEEEFENWRRLANDGASEPRARIQLLIERRPLDVGLVVEGLDIGSGSAIAVGLNEGEAKLEAILPGWHELDMASLPELGRILEHGLSLSVGDQRLEFEGEPILALRWDDDLGGFRTVRKVSYEDVHVLLVQESQLDSILHFLEEESAVVGEASPASDRLPRGWRLIENFRIDARPSIEPPIELGRLFGIKRGPIPRLEGGLRVGALRHVYLTGGAPVLQLPIGFGETHVTIESDSGEVEPVGLPAGGERIEVPLHRWALPAGRYIIEVGETVLDFDLVDWLEDREPPRMGSVLTRDGALALSGYLPVEGAAERRDSDLPDTFPRPDVGAKLFALGSAQDELKLLVEPSWLAELAGGLSWSVIEVAADFDIAWVVVEHASGAVVAHPREPLEPRYLDDPSMKWVRLMRKASLSSSADEESSARLEHYRETARCHRVGRSLGFGMRSGR